MALSMMLPFMFVLILCCLMDLRGLLVIRNDNRAVSSETLSYQSVV